MKPLFILLMGLFSTGSLSAQTHPRWIKQSVFYQIYPSSFQDNDGNGIGDLKGIQSRLDYVQSLGVNAIWLNPVFKSAFQDGGYDVIDFYQVDPRLVPIQPWWNLPGKFIKRNAYSAGSCCKPLIQPKRMV